jgi:fructan beta-fructosidase
VSLSLAACRTAQTPAADTATAAPSAAVPDEPHRPRFHFTPPAKWMNDPNGLVYLDGEYHLFYQHYPDSTVWGPMHWGHAVSTDLVHWTHLPIALAPDRLGYIFSGSAVVDVDNTSGLGQPGRPAMVAIFTYHDMAAERAGSSTFQSQGIAYSLDRGRTWTTYAGNPVLPNPGLRDFRDPKVFWHAPTRRWVLVLAAGDRVRLYTSGNLRDWRPASTFGADLGAHGGVWECPDLFPLRIEGSTEERWALLVSMNPGGPNGGSATQYFVGRFDGTTFTLDSTFAGAVTPGGRAPARGVWLDHGRDDYAGVTWSGIPPEDGRRLFIGWMSNWDYAQVVPTASWRSALTVPRALTLHRTPAGLRLFSLPVRELRALRTASREVAPRQIDTLTLPLPEGATANAAEVEIEVAVPEGAASDVALELSTPAGEVMRVGYDAAARRFYSDRRALPRAFSDKFAPAVHVAPRVMAGDVVRMHLLVDRASVELFADDGATVMSDVAFPSRDFSALRLVVKGAPVALRRATVWGLRAAPARAR